MADSSAENLIVHGEAYQKTCEEFRSRTFYGMQSAIPRDARPKWVMLETDEDLRALIFTHLATTLAKHLLGGEKGILYYGANKPLGQGIVALHPDMVDAINTYIHSDKVKLNAPPLISIGQAINGTLHKAYKSASAVSK
ncbi:hypothetical protein BV898_17621 [Hypsibius exemplaris]|uniref:Uncharacterized protein n=1 Tax=Hypsibius exemplaris TaxID=2072580 RepID=A0A9X6NFF4_HYPEX|nr:hypothetical protein BV898_17621 [Hypsibius exemplaris]